MDERKVFAKAAVLCGVALLGLLAGCSNKRDLREVELQQLAAWLPGDYDNSLQIEEDKQKGLQPHEPVAIAIVQVYAPILSKTVFYAQESAPDDPRRIMSQRLLAFDITEDNEIVSSYWALQDPQRWRNAYENPDLFKSMQPPDVQTIPGCGLGWIKETPKDPDKKNKDAKPPKPEHFAAKGGRATCRSKQRGPGGSVLFTETRIELTPDEFSRSEQLFDSQGRLVFGRTDEPFLRFRRRN